MPLPSGANGHAEVVIGLRPEALELAPDGLQAEVEIVEEFGADAFAFCVADVAGARTKLVARVDARGGVGLHLCNEIVASRHGGERTHFRHLLQLHGHAVGLFRIGLDHHDRAQTVALRLIG